MVEGVQQGPVLVETFFMIAQGYLPPTARAGDLGPHEPCPRTPQVQIVESVESMPDLEAREEQRCSGPGALVGHGLDMEDLASMCGRQCRRLAISAPLRRSWRRLAATAEPGVTESTGPQNPRRKPGQWRRIPARSGCGQLQSPRGILMAIGQLSLRSRRRWPYRPQGRTRPP